MCIRQIKTPDHASTLEIEVSSVRTSSVLVQYETLCTKYVIKIDGGKDASSVAPLLSEGEYAVDNKEVTDV